MSGFPGEEPPADVRTAAKAARGIFVALVNEGFTEKQALQMLGAMLAAAIRSDP